MSPRVLAICSSTRWFCSSASSSWTFSALLWISLSEHPALHRLADGAADGGDVERLVDVVARAQPQRLPDRVRRLKRRDHDRLDVRPHEPQPLQHFDARHARHADVQDRHVNVVLLRQFNRRRPVLGHQQIVIVLENHPQRHPRPFLVVHDQQRAAPFGRCRR